MTAGAASSPKETSRNPPPAHREQIPPLHGGAPAGCPPPDQVHPHAERRHPRPESEAAAGGGACAPLPPPQGPGSRPRFTPVLSCGGVQRKPASSCGCDVETSTETLPPVDFKIKAPREDKRSGHWDCLQRAAGQPIIVYSYTR